MPATGNSIVLFLTRVFRLLDRKHNPVIHICESEDAADGIEAEALFEIIHQGVNPIAEVLRGGRVVVVSHLDDVRGDFGNRYRISKDRDGYVEIERSV